MAEQGEECSRRRKCGDSQAELYSLGFAKFDFACAVIAVLTEVGLLARSVFFSIRTIQVVSGSKTLLTMHIFDSNSVLTLWLSGA